LWTSRNYLSCVGAEKGIQKWGGRILTIWSCCAEHNQHAKHAIAKRSGGMPPRKILKITCVHACAVYACMHTYVNTCTYQLTSTSSGSLQSLKYSYKTHQSQNFDEIKFYEWSQVIKVPLILIRSQLQFSVHYNKIIMALVLEIYCSFILDGFSLTIWPRFVKFIKLSLRQSFQIYMVSITGSMFTSSALKLARLHAWINRFQMFFDCNFCFAM